MKYIIKKSLYNMNIKHKKNFDFCNISATIGCNVTQMSTPQHVFQMNFTYILDILLLKNTFR